MRSPSWRTEFGLLTLIWGSSFMCMKVAVADLAAIDVALGRVALGTAALGVLLVVTRQRLPTGRRTWAHLAVAGLFANSIPFALQAYGETHISSVLGGLWNGTVPLFVLVGATLMVPQERPTRRRIAGFVVGFLGVVVVMGPWREVGGGDLAGQLMFVGASVSLGVGFPYMRRFLADRPESGVAMTCGQLLCATAQLGLATSLVGGAPASVSVDAVAAMLGIGVVGTGIAFALGYDVVRKAGATTAAAVTFFVPIVSTALGVLALGEDVSWNQPVGAAIVMTSIAIAERLVPLPRFHSRTNI